MRARGGGSGGMAPNIPHGSKPWRSRGAAPAGQGCRGAPGNSVLPLAGACGAREATPPPPMATAPARINPQ